MPGITQLNGKSFTIKLDGKQRTIGAIIDARVSADRSQAQITISLTDEEIAGLLGAAQDKNEAAASPLGLTQAEQADILATEVD